MRYATGALAPAEYWERRASRYAGDGAGLRAVCSYGMPGFYNAAIELTQKRALGRWLRVEPGARVLDLGCGIGRWSRLLARSGAYVTGVDLSPTMVAEAARRARADGLQERCRFEVCDVSDLAGGDAYDMVICVTVLQHVLSDEGRRRAVDGIAAALVPGGRAVVLEAAPTTAWRASDHTQFRPRTVGEHVRLFEAAGLRVVHVSGVDTTLVRKYALPAYGRVPRVVGNAVLAVSTALALPLDLAFARAMPRWSWHKLFILRRDGP